MKIEDIINLNLWPQSKKITSKKGIPELEELGYNLFYIGKNADLYTIPEDEAKVLLVRSDRCSVFDIPLNLQIEKKGIIQTAISNNGANFAKECGIKTAILDENVPSYLKVSSRCQIMELCKPLEAKIDGELVQFELIFRNYLTGSLYEACQKGKDPYGLDLSSELKQWHKFEKPIFTPTTKGVKDIPLNSQKVRELFPEIISSLETLFIKFTKFAYENGIIVVDTKLEVFVNSKGQWVLGDEILTPESSRFIAREEFEKGNYISMDKQILRNFAKENKWKEKAKSLKAGQKLNVNVPQEIKDEILKGYSTIYTKLNKTTKRTKMKAIVNVALKKGVLDDQGKATHHALDTLGFKDIVKDVRIGKQIIIELNSTSEEEAQKEVAKMCEKLLANTVIEDYDIKIVG